MLKGFKFPCAHGNAVSIAEMEGYARISIGIQEGGGQIHTVELSRDEWLELCELRYKVEVNDPPTPPPVIEESASNFVPAIRAERVADEEL